MKENRSKITMFVVRLSEVWAREREIYQEQWKLNEEVNGDKRLNKEFIN